MTTFTLIHVALSLVGIVSGLVVVFGMLTARRLDRWTALFLATTVATSVTGYGFPFERLLPSHIIGALSLVVLGLAVFARYARHLQNGWRKAYVITAAVALYFNIFVLIVQLFLKAPALKAMAPTQSEPPFVIVQLVHFIAFIVLTILATRKFRLEPVATARSAAASRTT